MTDEGTTTPLHPDKDDVLEGGQDYSSDLVSQPVFTELRSIAIVDGKLSVQGRFQFTPLLAESVEPPEGFTYTPHADDPTLFTLVGVGPLTQASQIKYRMDVSAPIDVPVEAPTTDVEVPHFDEVEQARRWANILPRVIAIVSEQMGVPKAKLNPEMQLVNDLGSDSLDHVELVMEFEDAFDLSIPDEDAEKITTIQSVVDYLVQHKDVELPR